MLVNGSKCEKLEEEVVYFLKLEPQEVVWVPFLEKTIFVSGVVPGLYVCIEREEFCCERARAGSETCC
jgi:hypothetical protein